MADCQPIRAQPQIAERLTPQEEAVMDLRHLRRREIAELLCMSESSVKQHIARAYEKLGAETAAQAVLIYQGTKRQEKKAA